MCLLVIAWRDAPGSRLLLLGNRDESHSRPSAPAAWWDDAPELLAGRDLEAGGTWLGVTRSGRFAVVTNVREPARAAPDGARSRGLLVSDYLKSTLAPAEFVAALEPERYAGFNLLLGDRDALWYASNRAAPRALAPGAYALSNATLDAPWPKVERLRERFAAARDDVAASFALLADREPAPDASLPDTGLPLELERLVSAPFVCSPGYGTRASYRLTIGDDGRAELRERSFAPDGRRVGERLLAFRVPG
jgi:uncharacterized protein with NRDE domain